MNNDRKQYVDIFKGIAIFLVVIAHSPICNNEVRRIIYCFHMPAFFFIYGVIIINEKILYLEASFLISLEDYLFHVGFGALFICF